MLGDRLTRIEKNDLKTSQKSVKFNHRISRAFLDEDLTCAITILEISRYMLN